VKNKCIILVGNLVVKSTVGSTNCGWMVNAEIDLKVIECKGVD
jgi:hypothetical protein